MQKKVLCEFCGKEIPKARLEILPDTTSCVKCSQAKPYSMAEALGVTVSGEQESVGYNYEDFDDGEGDYSI